jgi:hypothetical protein
MYYSYEITIEGMGGLYIDSLSSGRNLCFHKCLSLPIALTRSHSRARIRHTHAPTHPRSHTLFLSSTVSLVRSFTQPFLAFRFIIKVDSARTRTCTRTRTRTHTRTRTRTCRGARKETRGARNTAPSRPPFSILFISFDGQTMTCRSTRHCRVSVADADADAAAAAAAAAAP